MSRGGATAAVVLAMLAATARAEEGTVEYVVRSGDSCLGIAKRELGVAARYGEIHRLNPGLGPLPHHLVPGQRLLLPRRDPDARVTQLRGQVDARAPEADAWENAWLEMDLYRLWRVAARRASAAEITFLRDRSSLQMREETVVVIYGEREARRETSAATLVTGALRSRLDELAGRPPIVVTTAAARATLRGGSAVVAAEENGATRLANHRGESASLRTRSARAPSAEVAVESGMGSWVEPGRAPAPPRPLPAAPTWVHEATVFPALDGKADVSISWEPVDAAHHYRVELTRDVQGAVPLREATVPGHVQTLRVEALPEGHYHAFVSAVDGDQLEGPRGVARPVAVVAFAILPPAGVDGALGALVGSRVVPPDGYTCDEGSRSLLLRRQGPAAVVCRTPDGTNSASLRLMVRAPDIQVVGGVLRAGERSVIELETSLPVAGGVHLTSPDAEIHAVERRSPLRLRATLTPGPDARHVLVEATLGGVRTTRLRLPADPRPPSLSVGVQVSALALDQDVTPGSVAPAGVLAGARLALRTSRTTSLEAEVEAGATAGGRVVYGARGGAAFRAAEGWIRPVISVGAGVVSAGGGRGTARPVLVVGVGMEHSLTSGLDLRVEAVAGVQGGGETLGGMAGLVVGALARL